MWPVLRILKPTAVDILVSAQEVKVLFLVKLADAACTTVMGVWECCRPWRQVLNAVLVNDQYKKSTK